MARCHDCGISIPKLDDYLGRLTQLDRRVLLRYRIDDPFEALDNRSYGLPTYAPWDSVKYAKSLLTAAQALEANGNAKGAAEKYLTVAQFGQLLGPVGGFFVRDLQEAYKRLGAISQKEGNEREAAFYASLADQTDLAQQQELSSLRKTFRGKDVLRGGDVAHWNALVAKTSGVILLFSGALVLICVLAAVVRGRSVRPSSLHPSRLTLTLGFGGAVGSLLSSVMLYVTYRPYAEILQRFVRTGDDSQFPALSEFLADSQLPIGAQGFLHVPQFVLYFWFAVAVLCVLALLLVVWRYRHRPRVAAA